MDSPEIIQQLAEEALKALFSGNNFIISSTRIDQGLFNQTKICMISKTVSQNNRTYEAEIKLKIV